MTASTNPATLADLDVAGIPDVEGVPFAQAFADRFEPLTTYEAEHGPFVPKRVIGMDELIKLAGLASKSFGRERGIYVDTDEADEGPYLVVETRNGGYDATCWEDDDENCRCNACIQNNEIPDYPGFVHAEHTGGDSRNYFTLPAIPDDAMLPDGADEHGHLAYLDRERKRVLAGEIVPWFFAPDRPSHREVLDDYRRPYYGRWGSGLREAHDDLERKRTELAAKQAKLTELREAYANAEVPQAVPEPMYRRKTGVSGKPLRTKERVPVPGFVAALKTYRDTVAHDIDRETVTNDLERLATDESLPQATREWMASQARTRRSVDANPKYAGADARMRAERLYQMQMAYFAAPSEIERLERDITMMTKRIATIEADIAKAGDSNWWGWPDDDHDAYLAWMGAHGFEVKA